ncbi:VOC family protein [Devosia algicola]|uniref:VOC family protein n=1 Tax=Devosia algicola TaxID=3026418 RepID=A0ABY7YJE6_9HYPH|nr:VOC family protein [Devosia algicola]WDR01386.1 VOC family protein [Devosia algicola]
MLLHTKIDQMREKEVLGLTNTVEELQQQNRAHTRLRLELFVDDLAASQRFYTEVLGFSALPGQAGPYISLQRDGAIVALNDRNSLPTGHPVQLNAGGQLGKGIEIVLELVDIEAAYRAVMESGWPISSPLQAQSWGLNDFRVADPDGYYLRLSSAKS